MKSFLQIWHIFLGNFHIYSILVFFVLIYRFFVDGTPVRIFKNRTKAGAKFPKYPLDVRASLWNGTQWLGATNWSRGPFYSSFRGFEITGCSSQNENRSKCEEYWNSPKFGELGPRHQKLYESVKKSSITYDYCRDKNSHNFPECKMDETWER